MVLSDSLLVSLVKMIDRIPMPPPPTKRPRARPLTYPDRRLLKARVIMIIRRLYTAWALLRFLEQAEPLGQPLRCLLSEHGRFPSRRTWQRRLARLPSTRPALIGGLGRHRVQVLNPWAEQGHGAALDSTPLRAHGGVWHKKHRDQGVVPHTRIDPEAAGSKSGYHGGWYGWKLHLAVTLGRVWIPLAAEFTPAHAPDNVIAPRLLRELPLAIRYVLGDQPYNTPELRAECVLHNRERVATRRGKYPHADGGVEVRRLFHKLRSQAIEPFNGLFKNLFEWRGQMPVKGLRRCQLFALGAVLLYPLVWLYQHEQRLPVGVGIKPLLRAA
jgi:hypothetical protein